MRIFERFLRTIYPPKCILCARVLSKEETDLCRDCRMDQEEYVSGKKKISFIAQWTAMWYYKEKVRNSLHQFKFYNVRSHADAYGRLLAMHLLHKGWTDFDLVTWAPISARRRRERGYDQCKLLCKAVCRELGLPCVATLKKHRHVQPQSLLKDVSERRANVLGAYKLRKSPSLVGKRILLLDDIITTGATASECARMLMTAGAKEVYCAAIAATEHKGR